MCLFIYLFILVFLILVCLTGKTLLSISVSENLRICENVCYCEGGFRNRQEAEARLWFCQPVWRTWFRIILGKDLGSSICQTKGKINNKKKLTATLQILLVQRKQILIFSLELLSFSVRMCCNFYLKLLDSIHWVK